jgi:hypothetical protein
MIRKEGIPYSLKQVVSRLYRRYALSLVISKMSAATVYREHLSKAKRGGINLV